MTGVGDTERKRAGPVTRPGRLESDQPAHCPNRRITMSIATDFPPGLPTAKPGKRAKATSRPKARPAETLKKGSWYVSQEATRRLVVPAMMEGKSQSEVVDELLRGLNPYTMPSVNSRAPRPADSTLMVTEIGSEATG